jgi:hypothetical protein
MSRAQAETFELDEGLKTSHFREITTDFPDLPREWMRGTRGIYGRTLPARCGKPRRDERTSYTTIIQIHVVIHCPEH